MKSVSILLKKHEWMLLMVIQPLFFLFLNSNIFLRMQSIYYLFTWKMDPFHHLLSSVYLLYSSTENDISLVNILGLLVCLNEISIGLLMCPYIKSIYGKVILITLRLVIHPIIIWKYMEGYHVVFNILFLFIAIKHIVEKLSSTSRAAPYYLVKLRGLLKGVKVEYIDDIDDAKKVLTKCSLKGSFIEERLSLVAWNPIRSIESVDGKEWKDLLLKLRNFIHGNLRIPLLKEISKERTEELSKYTGNIGRVEIVRLICTIFMEWILISSNRELDQKGENIIEELIPAIEEWRKEIAVKGKGNQRMKENVIQKLKKYFDMDDIDYIIQPLFISPSINISDIALNLPLDIDSNDDLNVTILKSILVSHPFPFLERYVDKDIQLKNGKLLKNGTQVFIPIAQISKMVCNSSDSVKRDDSVKADYTKHFETLCFGSGPRRCPGSQYGKIVIGDIIQNLSQLPNFKPNINHNHSSRGNDKDVGDIKFFLSKVYHAIISPYITPESKL